MTRLIELTPEMEDRLKKKAHESGEDEDSYLRSVIEKALGGSEPAASDPINDPATRATVLSDEREEPVSRISKSEIYLHFVWATYRRYPWVEGNLEEKIYSSIQSECKKQDCDVLAIGGMPDHVHLAVEMPTKLSPARLMQQVKGVSSTIARQAKQGEAFGWQDGYGAFSLSRSHKDRVIAYVKGQKRHHSADALWTDWER